MRRIFVLILVLLLGVTVFIAAAQDTPEPTPIPVTPPPETSITYEEIEALLAADLPSFDLGDGTFIFQAEEGSDHCSTATPINLSESSPFGSAMDVANMTSAADDPILNCMWGSPTSNKGYRTVWYQFTPEYNGIMTVSTMPSSPQTSSYDTVVAVHTGACGSFATVACNDDKIGFSSEVTVNIRRGTTYYIEVASWSASGSSPQNLNILAFIEPFDTFWQEEAALVGGTTAPPPRVRHTTVMVGSDMYIFGGRGASGAQLFDTWQFNVVNKQWTSLPPFPPGFLNTTAVYLHDTVSVPPTRRIYVPGGNVDADGQNASLQHWYYDLDLKQWYQAPALVGGGTLTQTFSYAAAVANNSLTTPRYYVTGGVVGQGYPFTNTATALNQVLIYTPSLPEGDRWDVGTPMSSPRYGHTAAKVGDRICVTGGLNIDQDANQTVLIPNGECASAATVSTWFPTGNMNVPRYFAHSAVGADNKWYVYGGIDADGLPVAEVEVYDPDTGQWSVLPLPYDLGGQATKPALVWPRGGYYDNHLWSLGGSYDATGLNLEPRVFKLEVLPQNNYLPVIFNGGALNNHSFADALRLPLNQTYSQNFTKRELFFPGTSIFYNAYYFDLTQMKTVGVHLTNVPDDSIWNLYVYDDDKLLRGVDDRPFLGADKSVSLSNLPPGRYYIMVKQTFPVNVNPDNYYRIRVNG